MIKIAFTGVALVIGSLQATAAYTAAQRTLIDQIETHLEETGYHPKRVEYGLRFTSDDRTYFIEISEEASNPFLVRVCEYIPYGTALSRENIVAQLNDLNQEPLQKTIAKDNNVVIISETWADNAKEFNAAFPVLLDAVKYNASQFH